MQTTFDRPPQAPQATKPLWIAIGVLGVAVVAMGATMVGMHGRNDDAAATATMPGTQRPAPSTQALTPPTTESAAAASPVRAPDERSQADAPPLPPVRAPLAAMAPATQRSGSGPTAPMAPMAPAGVYGSAPAPDLQGQAGVYGSNPPSGTSQPGVYSSNPAPTQPAAPGVYGSNPAPVQRAQPGRYSSQPPAADAAFTGVYASRPLPTRPVCGNCGTVVSVQPVQRAGQANGTGAVAGGVLGAVVGNQFGHGSGRAAATVLGALGGGWAGHHVEQNIRQRTAYVLRVRMEDGSVRTIEQSRAMAVGNPVVLQGGTARLARAAEGSGRVTTRG